MGFGISAEVVDILMPSIVYWITSGIYTVLGMWFKDYRLRTKEEEEQRNMVSKADAIKGVLLQQFVHSSAVYLLFKMGGEGLKIEPPSSYLVTARQVAVALLVFDAYNYFSHRLLHQNKFLYKHFHSKHHRLVAPYAFAAFYSDISALFIVNIGSALTILISGMSRRTTTAFYCLVTVKFIDDHCGILFPNNPFHYIFSNTTAFHDVHHQLYGAKYNFSEPFFIAWDKIMGTYLPYSIEKRPEGGFQIRPIRDHHSKKERLIN